jgi:hypothetical protein
MRRLQVLTISILAVQALVSLNSSVCFAGDVSDLTQPQTPVELQPLRAGRSPASIFQTVQMTSKMKDADPIDHQIRVKSLFYATGKNDAASTLLSKTDKCYISIQHPLFETNFNVLVFGLPDHQQFFQQGGIGIAHTF